MDDVNYTRFFLALAFVIGLIWFCGWLAKRSGLDKKLRGVTGAQGRLAVVDVLYIDPKRKLTLVRADDREYLLFLAADRAEVIDRFSVRTDAPSA